ncbi:MAG TPA: hypothetical protein VFD01_22100 [Candidatus Dormibacteraeota bacterium]|nr:hypothetical protein [Candidatus Dormibacteraeota bacterium]
MREAAGFPEDGPPPDVEVVTNEGNVRRKPEGDTVNPGHQGAARSAGAAVGAPGGAEQRATPARQAIEVRLAPEPVETS